MYLIMFLVTGFGLLRTSGAKNVFLTDVVVSICGIFFAGSFVVQEFLRSRITGTLGLSTCVYGLVFYVLIFIISLIGNTQTSHE